MKQPRIRTLILLSAFVAGVGAALSATAAEWKPTRPINLIVPWAAGGSTDQVSRATAAELETVLGQKIVLKLGRGFERRKAVAHDDMAGGARAGHFARVFDRDPVFEQVLAQRFVGPGLDDGAFGTELDMRQDDDLRHAGSFTPGASVSVSKSAMRLPANARWIVLSMRSAAKVLV